jgi:hypothetical protein
MSFDTLPPETWGEILSHVELQDFRPISLVCRSFHAILKDCVIWERVFLNKYGYAAVGDARQEFFRIGEFQRRFKHNNVDTKDIVLQKVVQSMTCLGGHGCLLITNRQEPLFFAVSPFQQLKTKLEIEEPTCAAYCERAGILVFGTGSGGVSSFQRDEHSAGKIEWDPLAELTDEHLDAVFSVRPVSVGLSPKFRHILQVYFVTDTVVASVDRAGGICVSDTLFGLALFSWRPPKLMFGCACFVVCLSVLFCSVLVFSFPLPSQRRVAR